MCPVCLTTAALAVAGATTAGGLTAFTVKVLRKTGQERAGPAEGPYDGGSTVDVTGRKPAAVAPSVPDDTRGDPNRFRGKNEMTIEVIALLLAPLRPWGRWPGADGIDTGNDLKGAPCT
jgi:hypothetical protein